MAYWISIYVKVGNTSPPATTILLRSFAAHAAECSLVVVICRRITAGHTGHHTSPAAFSANSYRSTSNRQGVTSLPTVTRTVSSSTALASFGFAIISHGDGVSAISTGAF